MMISADIYPPRYMEPGAWLEHTEVEIKAHCDDGTGNPDGAVESLANYSHEMGTAYGTDFQIAQNMKEIMVTLGFTEVHEVKYKLPLGPWAADSRYKEIGKFFERFYKTGLQGWLMHILTTRLGVCQLSTNSFLGRGVLNQSVDYRTSQRTSSQDFSGDRRPCEPLLFLSVRYCRALL